MHRTCVIANNICTASSSYCCFLNNLTEIYWDISHSVCQVKKLLIILNIRWAKEYSSLKFIYDSSSSNFPIFLTFPRHNSAVIERMFRRSNVFYRLIDKNLHIYNVRRWNTRNGICIFIYTNRGACVMNA